MLRSGRLVLLALYPLAFPAAASADPGADCDRLAAAVVDHQRPAGIPTVAMEELDAAATIAACEAAVAAAPAEPRYLYQLGRGYTVANRGPDAIRVYRQAADLGYVAAYNNIGFVHQYGSGVPVDPKKAVENYRLAAEKGHAEAQMSLALFYKYGVGVAKDYALTVAWMQKAVDQKLPRAMALLADLYQNGIGVPKDESKAVVLLIQAATLGDADGQRRLGFAFSRGQGVAKNDKEAAEWFRKSAEQGLDEGMVAYAGVLAIGQGVKQDPVAAALWVRKAADKGSAFGQYYLGLFYYQGRIPGADPATKKADAVKWMKLAAVQGLPIAKKTLAELGEAED